MNEGIYFDNASTSFPKPDFISNVIKTYLATAGCSPGRSGHSRARKSEELIDNARKQIAELLGVKDPRQISYTYNATYALNMAIKGCVVDGDHVITTCFEHNSVLRPLEKLKRSGQISYTVVGLNSKSTINIQEYKKSFTPNTRLVVINHASNVTGAIAPVGEMIKIAHGRGAKVLVDISQTAGFLDINLSGWDVDFAAFTGHKSLLGLPGVGGLYVKDERSLSTVIEGGTGVNSISLVQPGYMPEKFEAGTLNYTGIVALGASSNHISDIGLATIRQHEYSLLEYLTKELSAISGLAIIGGDDISMKVPIISFVIEGIPSNEVSKILDKRYGIMTRPGIQCAPLTHKALGTSPNGTIRVSLGFNNTKEECKKLIEAIKEIVKSN